MSSSEAHHVDASKDQADKPIVAMEDMLPFITQKRKPRSIRKRKFNVKEFDARATDGPVESEFEGPFWFEKSTTQFYGPEKIHKGITRREHQLLRELVKSDFFSLERLENTVVPLNDENSSTPRLRSYDWAVTNFAKGQPCLQVIDGNIVDPNLDYQNALRKHHRLLFDPFRRGTHLFFEDSSGSTHRTTVGQLCFIKWCVEHHVDRYVELNVDAIRKHMSKSTKKHDIVKKRRELTKAPKKMLRGAIFDTMTIK